MAESFLVGLEIDEAFQGCFDATSVAAAVRTVLCLEEVARASLTVVVTDNQSVQTLNRHYRGIDAPTDVLSFAAQADEDSPQLTLPAEMAQEMAAYLGDIIIAFPYAKRQAAQYGNSIDAELRLLAVHGALHLLGYDHVTPDEEARMWAVQEAALASFGDQGLSHRHYEA